MGSELKRACSVPSNVPLFYYVQQPLLGEIKKLNVVQKKLLEDAKKICDETDLTAHDGLRAMNKTLAERVNSGEFKEKDIIFVPGIPQRPHSDLGYLVQSLTSAHYSAQEACRRSGIAQVPEEVFIAVSPVFFELEIPQDPFSQKPVFTHDFKEIIYDSASAQKKFADLGRSARDYCRVNRAMTASACQLVISKCRNAYLFAERSRYLGTNMIFKRVAGYEEIGGNGGVMRNANMPRDGVADKTAQNILAGFLAEKWRNAAKLRGATGMPELT